MPLKQCTKCKKWKDLKCFNKNRNFKNGRSYQCKECDRKWRNEHKDEIKQSNKKYRQEHRRETIEYLKKYNQEHKKERHQYYQKYREEILGYHKKYREKHKNEIAQYQREWQREHKDKIKQYNRKYQGKNKERRNQYSRTRYINDPCFRLNGLMSNAIRQAKKPSIKQSHPWKDLVPYSLIELKKHLKSSLPKGYIWKDFMEGKLHIDHILPVSIFKYEKSEDLSFQICWGLENLRLIPVKENLRKNSKLIKPFQEHFAIEVKIK